MADLSWTDIDLAEFESLPSPSEPASSSKPICHRVAIIAAGLVILTGVLVTMVNIWEFFEPRSDQDQFRNVLQGKFASRETGMALTTGLAFLLCGAVLMVWLKCRTRPLWRRLCRLAVTLLLLGTSYLLLTFSLKRYFDLNLPTDGVWGSPFGEPRMSPLTAAIFFTLGLVLYALLKRSRRYLFLAGLGTFSVGLFSLLLMLGYLYQVHLLAVFFGVPVALITAVTFFLFCVALIAALGPEGWPLREFLGQLPRALMLRYLLPVIVVIFSLDNLVRNHLLQGTMTREQMIIYSGALCLGTAGVMTLVIWFVANIIGGWLEQAVLVRDKAIDDFKMAVNVLKRAKVEVEKKTKELQEANKQLVDLTNHQERVNQELENARETIEQQMAEQSEFMSNISHELRTPLQVVLGYSSRLLKQLQSEHLEGKLLRSAEQIVRSGDDLAGVLEDQLNFFKYKSGRRIDVKLDEFDLARLIADRREEIAFLAQTRGNQFECIGVDGELLLTADKRLVWRVLNNLLSNACKYTEAGLMRLEVKKENGWLVLRVHDTGPGIPEKLQKVLFQRFERGRGVETQVQTGTGLGLSITRLYCREMNGSIDLERSETTGLNHGSTFVVRLPLAPSATRFLGPYSETRVEKSAATLSRGGSRVLIIEDDERVRDLWVAEVQGMGYKAETASDGLEGLRAAKNLLPAAILLDIKMPGIDGWAVLAALKNDGQTSHIPIILATVVDDENRGYALGADDYLVKPFTAERLGATLRKHLGQCDLRRVLVVAAIEEQCVLLRQALEGDDMFRIDHAVSGAQAIKAAEEVPPDLILIDLRLPDADERQVINWARNRPGKARIPLVVLTEVELDPEPLWRFHAEFDAVLSSKTLAPHALRDRVKELLGEIVTASAPTEEVAHGENLVR